MKIANYKEEEIPALNLNGSQKSRTITLDEAAKTGLAFSGVGMNVGDIVEFPDTEADLRMKEITIGANGKDVQLLVLKNGKLAWISMGYLCRKTITDKENPTSNNQVPIHPVSEELSPMHDNKVRLKALVSKTVKAEKTVERVWRKFENGAVVDGEWDIKQVPYLKFVS